MSHDSVLLTAKNLVDYFKNKIQLYFVYLKIALAMHFSVKTTDENCFKKLMKSHIS